MKKISNAIKKGVAIAEEEGITQTTGDILVLNPSTQKIECACALGFALIGAMGLKAATELAISDIGEHDIRAYQKLTEILPATADTKPECLLSIQKEERRKKGYGSSVSGNDVQSFIYNMNDIIELTPIEIADRLKKCGY